MEPFSNSCEPATIQSPPPPQSMLPSRHDYLHPHPAPGKITLAPTQKRALCPKNFFLRHKSNTKASNRFNPLSYAEFLTNFKLLLCASLVSFLHNTTERPTLQYAATSGYRAALMGDYMHSYMDFMVTQTIRVR